MNLFINPCWIHPSNKKGFLDIVSYLKLNLVGSIEEADIIYSASEPLACEQYPHKKFIFGPHFSVFPESKAFGINNVHKNAVYIQPSEPSVKTWVEEFNYTNTPVKSFPFPLDIPDISNKEKTKVVLYYKERSLEEFNFIQNFLKTNNIDVTVIKYGEYNERDYQNLLDETKYVIWHGRHESQGFALQSCWAKNIPTYVWSVRQRRQQKNCSAEFLIKGFTEVSTVPYWSDECGKVVYTSEEFKNKFFDFLNNLKEYTPQKFVENNLTVIHCAKNLMVLVNNL